MIPEHPYKADRTLSDHPPQETLLLTTEWAGPLPTLMVGQEGESPSPSTRTTPFSRGYVAKSKFILPA